jgi:hypothetical protein
VYQRIPLYARCELLHAAAVARACGPALAESGLHGFVPALGDHCPR